MARPGQESSRRCGGNLHARGIAGDAARTAFEAGNSAAMVHRYYKELVTSKDAAEWSAFGPHSSRLRVPMRKCPGANVSMTQLNGSAFCE
jgi:hypothetical protein